MTTYPHDMTWTETNTIITTEHGIVVETLATREDGHTDHYYTAATEYSATTDFEYRPLIIDGRYFVLESNGRDSLSEADADNARNNHRINFVGPKQKANLF